MALIRRFHVLAFASGFVAAIPAPAVAQRRVCRVSEVTVSPPDAQVRMGGTYPFLAVAYDAAGNPCDQAVFSWTSSNIRAATIDRDGIATGVSVGVSIITATTGTGTARRAGQATINVTAAGPTPQPQTQPPPGLRTDVARPTGAGGAAVLRQPAGEGTAEGLVIDPLQVLLVRGETRALQFRAVKGDGTNATPVPVVFTVEPGGESRVTVDSLGLITSLGDSGVATVRATVPGVARIAPKMIRVEVRNDPISFRRSAISLSPGMVDTLTLMVPAQERPVSPIGFQFTSGNPNVVRVNPVQPIIEGVGPGQTVVRAQSAHFDVSITVTVHRRVASISVQPADSIVIVPVAGQVTIRVQALGEDGTPVPEAPLRWTRPDTTLVAYDSTTRTLTGRRAGMTQLSITAPVARESVLTRVVRFNVVAGGLAASRSHLGLPYGAMAAVEVSLLDDQRRPIGPAQGLRWRSSNDSVAVYEQGQVVARKPGRAILTATAASWDSTTTIDVAVAGDLIVSALKEGRYDLYMLWAGGAPLALSSDSSVETFPAWSPELRRVAYVSAPAGYVSRTNLWVMNADGSERRQLTSDSALIRHVSWVRPEGRRLVFEWARGGSTQIWLYDLDSNQAQRITSGTPNTQPAVSPDGQRISFVGARETGPGNPRPGIYSMALDGSDVREMVVATGLQAFHPQYSTDGQSLLFIRREPGRSPAQRVWRVRIGAPADSAAAVTPQGVFVSSFSVSADGAYVACQVLSGASGEMSRVQIFDVSTGTFADAPGLAPEERASTPVMRPPPVPGAGAGATAPPR